MGQSRVATWVALYLGLLVLIGVVKVT